MTQADLVPIALLLERLVDRVMAPVPAIAPPAETREYWTPEAAGERLGVSAALIRRLIREGKLPAFRQGEGLMVRLEDVRGALALAAVERRG